MSPVLLLIPVLDSQDHPFLVEDSRRHVDMPAWVQHALAHSSRQNGSAVA
jgi:hypothetical protein